MDQAMKALINNKQTNQSIRSIKLSINYSIRITLESIHQLITSKERKKGFLEHTSNLSEMLV